MSIRTTLIFVALQPNTTCISSFIMNFVGKADSAIIQRKADKEYEQAKQDRTYQAGESLVKGLV